MIYMASSTNKENIAEVPKAAQGSLPSKFMFNRNVVAVVELEDYNSENIQHALTKVFNLLEIDDFVEDKSVLVKPNALAPSKHAYTPPEMVGGVVKFLTERNAENILVGDSTMTKNLSSLTLKRSDIQEFAEDAGARIINFFESDRIKVSLKIPAHEREDTLYLPQEIGDYDMIVNLPKLKTHKGYVYTGAIKNLFGLLSNKMAMHMTHKNKQHFQQHLADIYFSVEETNNTDMPKVLTIMDAVIAMEGNGPRGGDPRKVGLLIAGFNPAAIDIVGYSLMNGNPRDLEAINSVARRTGLEAKISALDIRGVEDINKYVIKNFKKPKIATLKKDQVRKGLMAKIADKAMRISIKIDQKKCVLCKQCVNHCPAEAMFEKDGKVIIDYEACVECFCCGESCPNDAVSAKWWIFRKLPIILTALVILGIAAGIGIWQLVVFLVGLLF